MVAFAVGGLLGDTLFHLLPETFPGEAGPNHARFVLVSPNKNLLLGVAIMVGFLTFVAMDKGLRIATGGEGGHEHSHGCASEPKTDSASAKASGSDTQASDGDLMSRKGGVATDPVVLIEEKKGKQGAFAVDQAFRLPQRHCGLYPQHHGWPRNVILFLRIPGDLLLPFTAGIFLYVGTVAVIPELLETGPNKGEELRKTLIQSAAMAVGAGIMLAISWS
ncbi:MAG: hypothetical protein L6R38_000534 [Xanthoria sp. 2 TBL-2021]|nr:MAG: hypothetical protein L6R38_000534 [Xanthoria sp. 2 TBL-2021]